MGGNLNRVLVLGLDGYPHSLLQERLKRRPSSIWHSLLDQGSLFRTRSSRPEVSSVAWASYLTGDDPGEHGLLGFIDRTLDPFKLYFPNGSSIKMPTIPERVHEAGGTAVSINVPATYPPKDIRGLIIGGFLGVRLEKNVKPVEWLIRLRDSDYIIDADPSLAYKDKSAFYNHLLDVQRKRTIVATEAAREFDWDFFQLHLMETDRLFHFYWGEPSWKEKFHTFLDEVDEIVEQFSRIADSRNASLVIMSDHGFTRANRIFFVNTFLRQAGYLDFDNPQNPGIETISTRSRAYALPPGRVFLNVRGREPAGSISPGTEYERERDKLIALLREVKDPLDGNPVFLEVLPRESVYKGQHIDKAADILAFSRKGIDLKADFNSRSIFETPSTLVGTHTYDDALFYVRGDSPGWQENEADVSTAGRYVLKLLGISTE